MYLTLSLRQYYRLHLDKLAAAIKRARARTQSDVQPPQPQPAYKPVPLDAATVQV